MGEGLFKFVPVSYSCCWHFSQNVKTVSFASAKVKNVIGRIGILYLI